MGSAGVSQKKFLRRRAAGGSTPPAARMVGVPGADGEVPAWRGVLSLEAARTEGEAVAFEVEYGWPARAANRLREAPLW